MTTTTEDVLDIFDYKNLLFAICTQSIDDYIKLAHPYHRRKFYLEEHYLNALDFIFDDTYRISTIQNGFNDDMSIEELLKEVLDSERNETDKLRAYVVKEAKKYWEEKPLAVVDYIPDTVFISGHTFDVLHSEEPGFEFSEQDKKLFLNKKFNYTNQANFFRAVVFLTALVSDSTINIKEVHKLSDELLNVMKTNNFFSYVGTGGNASPQQLS